MWIWFLQYNLPIPMKSSFANDERNQSIWREINLQMIWSDAMNMNMIPCWIGLLQKTLNSAPGAHQSVRCQNFRTKSKFRLYYIAWNEGNKHLIGTWCEYAFCSTISQFQWNLLRGKMDQKNITWNHLIRTCLL